MPTTTKLEKLKINRELTDFKVIKTSLIELIVVLKVNLLEISIIKNGKQVTVEAIEFDENNTAVGFAYGLDDKTASGAFGYDNSTVTQGKITYNDYSPDTIFLQFDRNVYQIQIDLINYLNLVKDDYEESLVKHLVHSDQSIQSFSLEYDANGFRFKVKTKELYLESEIYPIFKSITNQSMIDQGVGGEADQFDYEAITNVPLKVTAKPKIGDNSIYPQISLSGFKQVSLQIQQTRVKIQEILNSVAKLSSRYL
jgi:hypothetical protein